MKYIFSLILFFSCALLGADKVSVIVPCYYGHFHCLPGLLKTLSCQTSLPDEVVISLSEANKVSKKKLKLLRETLYPFRLKIIESRAKIGPGYNRNIACANAEGDIIITMDADDIPHPQRIEIIKYFFDRYGIVHLMHRFQKCTKKRFLNDVYAFNAVKYDCTQIPFFFLRRVRDIDIETYRRGPRITNGNIAFRRVVLDLVKWTAAAKGEDVIFNCQVYETFKKSMIIQTPLLLYRRYYSSSLKHHNHSRSGS